MTAPANITEPARGTAIALRNITKRFGPVLANSNVSIEVEKGTIHGIVGENGAGKSTLMSILYGFYQADAGDVLVNGELTRIRNSSDAIRAGIGMVHQHFMLIEPLSVVENVLLGTEEHAIIRGTRKKIKSALRTYQDEYQLAVPPDAVIASLPVGVRQRVEIIKALYRNADILILDEPTGVLTPSETDSLFRLLVALRDRGKTIILITHKLREILAVTSAVTVMRQGKVVATVATKDTNQDELAAMMVGRRVTRARRRDDTPPGRAMLDVRDLCLIDEAGVNRLRNVTFTVGAGEILGIAGVSGNGQSELMEVLAGMRPPTSGEVIVDEQVVTRIKGVNAKTLRTLGVAHIPEDRMQEGLVARFSATENAILGYQDSSDYNGVILSRRDKIIAHAEALMRQYDVRPQNSFLKAANFSGGNQQKLIVGREVERDPKVLLVGQPTRGVDIGAIEQIHQRLLDLRSKGKAILLVSVELDEILALADRVIVMFEGGIVGEVPTRDADERMLGLMMAGVKPN